MQRRARLVGWFWRWHRRLGLLAALFALVLAATGIVLNHTAELALDRKFVDWSWLHRAYGDRSGELPAYQVGRHWLYRATNGRLYLDTLEVAPCRGDLVGAVEAAAVFYAGCAEELLMVSGDGELIESITASTGLPSPLTGIGLVGSGVALQAGEAWWLADLESLDFGTRAPGGVFIQQLAGGSLPATIRGAIPARDEWLSWERVLLDLHSGRLFGRAGVLMVDLIGVLLGGLAVSGVAMWWLHRRRHRS